MTDAPFWQRALRYIADHWGFWGSFALLVTGLLALWLFDVPVADIVRRWFGG